MASPNAKSTSVDARCYSTSLTMCQGVLEYDLTYNVSMRMLQTDLGDYQSLVNSNCSARSVEFICAVLEPECRPSHIGILPPCRRICKGKHIRLVNGSLKKSNDFSMCSLTKLTPLSRKKYIFSLKRITAIWESSGEVRLTKMDIEYQTSTICKITQVYR